MRIDKESSAELSEAINSMYRWYADATVCYVYLADVTMESHRRGDIPKLPQDVDYLRPKFAASRWFTRGWLGESNCEFEACSETFDRHCKN